jgi:hypothetical protein
VGKVTFAVRPYSKIALTFSVDVTVLPFSLLKHGSPAGNAVQIFYSVYVVLYYQFA